MRLTIEVMGSSGAEPGDAVPSIRRPRLPRPSALRRQTQPRVGRVCFVGKAFMWSLIGAWAKVVLGRYAAAPGQRGGRAEQARGSGHHREAVLVFSSWPQSGSVPEPRER
jgi:hypothetical protein